MHCGLTTCLAAVLLLTVASCSRSSPTGAVADAPLDREAYSAGVRAAEESLCEGAPVIYVAGLVQAGRDPETGLPLRSVAGCVVFGSQRTFIAAHNNTIRSRLRACQRDGSPAHSAGEPCTTGPTSSPRSASPSR